MLVTYIVVSVNNDFVHLQSTATFGYYAFGEVARFAYCFAEDEEARRDSMSGSVGEVYSCQPFKLCCHRRGAVPFSHPSLGSS